MMDAGDPPFDALRLLRAGRPQVNKSRSNPDINAGLGSRPFHLLNCRRSAPPLADPAGGGSRRRRIFDFDSADSPALCVTGFSPYLFSLKPAASG